jgi:hypothetical protein
VGFNGVQHAGQYEPFPACSMDGSVDTAHEGQVSARHLDAMKHWRLSHRMLHNGSGE